LALDIDEGFQLDQATFQSMVVGEEVSIIRKYKQPITVAWSIHGGFAGNKLPSWTDNGGSLSRRLVVIEFLKVVTKCDPNLFEKCQEQRDRFLKVVVSAYHELTSEYKTRGIKEVIPEKFKASEKKALMELNSLMQYVTEFCEVEQSDDEDQNFTVLFKDFNLGFKEYCASQSIKPRTLNYSFYNGVFAKYQIKVITPDGNANNINNHGYNAKFVLGLRLKNSPSNCEPAE
jgi:phage/plasmid-associated DNA primase